jgi:hypothetical protein
VTITQSLVSASTVSSAPIVPDTIKLAVILRYKNPKTNSLTILKYALELNFILGVYRLM